MGFPWKCISSAPPLNVAGDQAIEAEEVALDAAISHLPAQQEWPEDFLEIFAFFFCGMTMDTLRETIKGGWAFHL